MTKINLLNNALDAQPPYTFDDYLFDFDKVNLVIAAVCGMAVAYLVWRLFR